MLWQNSRQDRVQLLPADEVEELFEDAYPDQFGAEDARKYHAGGSLSQNSRKRAWFGVTGLNLREQNRGKPVRSPSFVCQLSSTNSVVFPHFTITQRYISTLMYKRPRFVTLINPSCYLEMSCYKIHEFPVNLGDPNHQTTGATHGYPDYSCVLPM